MTALPFVAGLVAGAAIVSALRSERARSVMDEAGGRLRTAARSGLGALRRVAKTATETAAPAAKPARKRAAAKKAAAPRRPRAAGKAAKAGKPEAAF